jgi:hypothetical protein
MAALAEARPSALDPARLAGSHRQAADLEAILATAKEEPGQGCEAGRRARTPRPRVGPGRIALPVASVTAAVLAILAVGSQLPNQPAGQNRPGGGTEAGGSQREVETVLLPMASMAQDQTQAASGDYWEEDTITGLLAVADTGTQPYLVSQTARVVASLGVHPGEQSLLLTGEDAVTGPASPHDASLWSAAGSPKTVYVDAPGAIAQPSIGGATSPPGPIQTLAIGTGEPSATQINLEEYMEAFAGAGLDYAELQEVLGYTDDLNPLLAKMYMRISGNMDPNAPGRSQWMFDEAADLITMPVPSSVRAAAYRVLAGLPGIEDFGPVADVSGRSGVALSLATQYSGALGSVRDELIVDPQSDSLLAAEQVLITPSAEARRAGLKPGMAVEYTSITSVGWSDQQITVPAGTKD